MPKRATSSHTTKPLAPRLRKHIRTLGLRGIEDYGRWCDAHGFPLTNNKSHQALQTEIAALAADKAALAEKLRLDRNPAKLIDAACSGQISSNSLHERPQLQRFCKAIEKSRTGGNSRAALALLLHKVNSETDLLLDSAAIAGARYPYVNALIKLNDRRGQWIRPLAQWRPGRHNARRQFAALARYLLAHYPVPAFMDEAWFRDGRGSNKLRNWFVHIGEGKNIRTADTPVPLSKLMAHYFMLAPESITIERAIRWGQIHALGGDKRLVEAVLGSRIGSDFQNDEFWITVLRFFIANPMLDRRHISPIIDYLNNQKYEERQVFVGGLGLVNAPPPQPNLSMRGRTAGTLLDQVERWHRELGRSTAVDRLAFKPSGIKPLEMSSGRQGESLWRIRELLTGAALAAEGRAMRHCVASYARSCSVGSCSIWTLEHMSPSGTEKRQTIEVTRAGVIVQCRGKLNRLPTISELAIVKEWAKRAGLTLSSYVHAAE